ncbi:MAG: iron ABC transporter permease [Deltaproteobacteria bacterium]|nr:iron ABC transporter permease [Deltaproteobacteria bacterium]
MAIPHLTWARLARVNGLLLALLAASVAAAVTIGPVALTWGRVFAAGGGPNPDAVILFQTRLPRVLLAAIVGGALAISGAALQALLRNPLAEPHLVGISSGAALAAALALVTMPVVLGQAIVAPVAAFLGALASLWIVVRLALVGARVDPTTLLLVGVIYNAFTGALLMFLNSIADLYQVHGVLFWLMGHVGTRGYPLLAALALYSLAGLALLLRHARDLDCLSLGDERASELGVDVERARRTAFVAAALLVGAVVSVSGLIGFVGLVVPHLVRLVCGADHRLLLPASYLAGAIFLVWADTAARTVLGVTEIPVGVVTALCGAPVFAYLLRRERTLGGS